MKKHMQRKHKGTIDELEQWQKSGDETNTSDAVGFCNHSDEDCCSDESGFSSSTSTDITATDYSFKVNSARLVNVCMPCKVK